MLLKLKKPRRGRKETAMTEKQRAHRRKMIAPVVITVIFVGYFVLYFALLVTLVPGFWPKALLGVFPLGLAIALIGVCVSRIREIQGGEEDDLSDY
jgi:hypothetical protein